MTHRLTRCSERSALSRARKTLASFVLAALSAFAGATARSLAEGPAREVLFNRDIRPILSESCFRCHGPDRGRRKADLRLDVAASATKDRGGYRVVVPGKPEKSELLRRVTHEDPDERMPPADSGKTLSPAQIALLERWIETGARYEKHWSYAPLRRPALPPVKDAAWPRGEIDRFVLARIEAAGLAPSPAADPATLARRLSFDLTGLPPEPADIEELARDPDGTAYERLVDRLLASPHFGERMAIYWLDLVRYADTVGYHGDQEHNIFPYRDWVIRAFNENMPFDRFTAEQLAGDLLPEATVDQKIASGYNRVLQTTHEGGAQDGEYLAKYAADRVRNVSTVWMGATMGCAECHDHKYDPYTQKDFYSMEAFFADIQERGAYEGPDKSPTKRPPEIDVLSPLDRAELARLDRELERLRGRLAGLARTVDAGGGDPGAGDVGAGRRGGGEEAARERSGPSSSLEGDAELEELRDLIAALETERAEIEKRRRPTMITVAVEPRAIRVLSRGDWMDTSGEIVEPAVPEFLGRLDTGKRRATRLDLARWLTSPDHPQTARVLANRLWYLFFGEGLSRVLDDTGSQGAWPTHPDLLDRLAVELVESGWDVKRVVRRLVLSSVYRQSSRGTAELRRRDPENRLFARQGRFRLPAEMIRDAALAASGLLVRRVGGPSARPYQPAGYYAHLNFPKREYEPDTGESQYRRGVYTHWQRQFLHPMLRAFDAPSREECTARRPVSNTPLAALTLLNDPSFVEAARVFAERIIREGGSSIEERIRRAWRRALGRRPDARETAKLARFFADELAHYREHPESAAKLCAVGLAPRPGDLDPAEVAAWTSVARAIFNLDEFITRS